MNEYSDSRRSTAKSTATDLVPISIERDGEAGIVITWSDGKITPWSVRKLRNVCPCATCREKNRSPVPAADSGATKRSLPTLPILSAAEARPLRIEGMQPVGSYAYNISFSDGHSSGIFPFVLLHDGDLS